MRTTFILALAAVIVATPVLARQVPGSAGSGGRMPETMSPGATPPAADGLLAFGAGVATLGIRGRALSQHRPQSGPASPARAFTSRASSAVSSLRPPR